jgi:hypothetical protein
VQPDVFHRGQAVPALAVELADALGDVRTAELAVECECGRQRP